MTTPSSVPNILFVQTDQLTAFALSAYGNTYSKTPHLDQLASNGVVFDTAYCNFPLCAPSRYSMASGRLASRIGAYDNAVEFPATIPTYAHYLRAAGYQTCLSGKMHFVGPDQLHGFEQRLTPDIYPADFSWAPNWVDEGQRDTSDTTGVTTSGRCRDSVQLQYDNLVQSQALARLDEIAASGDKRPFFLQVSFTHPHDPYLCLEKHWDLYNGLDVPMPQVGVMPADRHDIHSRRILAQHSMLDFKFDPADVERARRAYYGSVSYIDDCVGDLVASLEKNALLDNTVIVFTSDHGEMLGERGMWFKKTFFEHALRIPLLVSCPQRYSACRVSTPVSLIDLLPTFMAWAGGVNEVEPLDGQDISLFINNPVQDENRLICAEYLSETTPAPIYMLKRGRYKFISSIADPDLLFDLQTDPDELINRADDPALAEVVREFKRDITRNWDNDTLTRDILLSQKRRLLLNRASRNGTQPGWDYDKESDTDIPWYRGVQGYNQWAYNYVPVDD